MKRLLLVAIAVCGLFAGAALLSPEIASAVPKDEICQGVGAVSTGGCTGGGKALNGVVSTIINIFSGIIGIVAVVMIMVAGFKYVSSGGDSSKVSSAKSTILYAVIGLVIVAFAQTIVWFVLERTTETDAERKKREKAAEKATLAPTPRYYTIEFNNKTVV